ncbi:hypothetical protein SMICM17S_12536 [Streptomyces microflavus]
MAVPLSATGTCAGRQPQRGEELGRQECVHRGRRARTALVVSGWSDPAEWLPVEEPGGLPLREPRQRQSPRHPGRFHRRQRPRPAVHLQRIGRAVLPGGRHRRCRPRRNADLATNVSVFDLHAEGDHAEQAHQGLAQQETNQFGSQPCLFKPGRYDVDANVGFYTQVAGLGLSRRRRRHQRRRTRGGRLVPGQRHPQLLALRREPLGQPAFGNRPLGSVAGRPVPAACMSAATSSSTTEAGGLQWPTRRSTDRSAPGTQQQWLSRDREQLDRIQLEHGLRRRQRPRQQLPQPALHHGRPDTREPRSPTCTWTAPTRSSSRPCEPTPKAPPGVRELPAQSLPISQLLIAKPGATASQINAALAEGKNLLHPGGLPPQPDHQRHPRRHRRPGPRARHRHPSRTASPRSMSPTSTASRSPGS